MLLVAIGGVMTRFLALISSKHHGSAARLLGPCQLARTVKQRPFTSTRRQPVHKADFSQGPAASVNLNFFLTRHWRPALGHGLEVDMAQVLIS